MIGPLPTALWVPPAIVLAGMVIALVADALGRRTAAVLVQSLALASAAVAGFVLAGRVDVAFVEGLAAYGAGFTSLPALGYAVSSLALLGGSGRMAARDRGPAMAVLVSLGAVFAHALLASFDLVVLFVALSGLAVVGYGLVAGAGTRSAEEASVRYFVQGAVATGLTLYGLGLVFALGGGSTDYLTAAGGLSTAVGRPALLALGLVLSAFAFKIGAFPFHSWVPDAYESGDASSVAFLTSVPKLAAVIAVLVLVRGTLFEAAVFAPATNLLVALGIGSLLFGAFGMLRQTSAARLLGYSGIAQVGYALLAIASGDGGVRATVIFMVTYALGAATAFLALEAVGRSMSGWDGSIDGLTGLSRRCPIGAASLAVAMLSLTGIPLLAGFWGKLHVFVSLLATESLWVALGAAIAAVVSFGGYGRVIRAAYFGAEPDSLGDTDAGIVSEEPDAADSGSEAGVPSAEVGEDRLPGTRRAVIAAAVGALAVIAFGVMPFVYGITAVYSLFNL
mgnify:FL=1